jgi:hypothetical protein
MSPTATIYPISPAAYAAGKREEERAKEGKRRNQ